MRNEKEDDPTSSSSPSSEEEQARPIHTQIMENDRHHHHHQPHHHHHHHHKGVFHEPSSSLPENQLRRKHSSGRRKSHRHRSSHRRSSHRRRSSAQEDGILIHEADAHDGSPPNPTSQQDNHDSVHHDHYRRHSSRRHSRSSGRQSEEYHENSEHARDEKRCHSNQDRSESPQDDEMDEIESYSASSLPTVFKRNGVGGSIRDDLSEITNMFSLKKKYLDHFNDMDDDDSTIESSYQKRLPKNGCTIIILICAVIIVSVGTALLIVVGASQDLDGPNAKPRQPTTTKGDNSTSSRDPSKPTVPPSPIFNTTGIRPIIVPPSLAECKSIAAGSDYFGSSLTDGLMDGYFAIDMDVHVRNQVTYRGNNFVKYVLPEIEMAIQKKLLPLLVGCKYEWLRRRRRQLVTEYPILNAKVVKIFKQTGRCIQTPISCYKISVEIRLTFIEMGPFGPVVAKITELFTEQTIVEQLELESIIEDTDTTNVRKLDSPPSSSPTLMPTDLPSALPSIKASDAPTTSPTTVAPTRQPSINPSKSPTDTPSSSPTRFPTRTPSSEPTPLPTVSPSAAPSLRTSSMPTEIPSLEPSMKPSTAPSSSYIPSIGPSGMVSLSPSISPSSGPTIADSNAPSRAPPSASPSWEASHNPTVSDAPPG